MTLTRRGFLGGVAPAAMAPLLPGCTEGLDETRLNGAVPPALPAPWPAPAPDSPFLHGVASGDPLSDRVVLWTRVTREQPAAAGADDAIEVEWRISSDPELEQLVAQGTLLTDASSDYTLHVDATGLSPGSTYYFQFRALGRTSVRGRTRTLPAGNPERVRLGVVSCANYPAGFFNVYGLLAQADVDFVLHLGDYIYEYQDGVLGNGASIGRAPEPPRELLSLADYRQRHAQYKRDPDLQALHRQHPFVAMWDDHDIANNSYRDGAQNHQTTEGDFRERKAAALQAYREWLPLRPSERPEILYRSLACGELLDLLLLDARNAGRDRELPPCDAALGVAARQLLGAEQEAWLDQQLRASQLRGARWRLIGQQVMLAPRALLSGCVQTPDAWDGYPGSRARLLDALEQGGIENVVVLTGDAHASWGSDVPRDPFDAAAYDPSTGAGSRLVELITPAVSSPAPAGPEQTIRSQNPHVKFVDQVRHGYLLVDVTPDRVLGEWYLVPTVREASAEVELGALLETRPGQPYLLPAAAPSLARAELPAPAR